MPNETVDPTWAAWQKAQKWEAGWWGSCTNTFGEETKQITYAHRMGLVNIGQGGGYWPLYDLAAASVLDLGGGPVSMLLKTINLRRGVVVDPGEFPPWVAARYKAAGLDYRRRKAEDFTRSTTQFDECWIYNVLQHVVDPEKIVANARKLAITVRLFEWIDLPPYEGHLHMLTQADLDRWLDTAGSTEQMNENGCVGPAYYAVASGR